MVRSLHMHAGEKVLDVAGGAGNTALAAARRWAEVVFVPITARSCCGMPSGALRRKGCPCALRSPTPSGSRSMTARLTSSPPPSVRCSLRTSWALRPSCCCVSCGEVAGCVWLIGRRRAGWVRSLLCWRSLCRHHRDWCRPVCGVLRSGCASCSAIASCLWEPGGSRWRFAITTRRVCLSFASGSGRSPRSGTRWAEPQREKFQDSWIALADKFNIARDGTCEMPFEYLEVVAVKA